MIHNEKVLCIVQISPNIFASASRQRDIYIWKLDEYAQDKLIDINSCIKILHGHTAPLSHLIKLTDNIMASCSWDKTIKLWDIDIDSSTFGSCIKTLVGHQKWINCIDKVSNYLLVSCSDDTTTRLWDVNPLSKTFGNCLKVFINNQKSIVYSVKVLSNDLIITSTNCHSIRPVKRMCILDINSGECLKVFSCDTDNTRTLIEHLTISPTFVMLSDDIVAIGFDDKIRLINIDRYSKTFGEYINVLEGHTSYIICITKLSPTLLMSSSSDGTIRIWNVDKDSIEYGKCVKIIFEIYSSSIGGYLSNMKCINYIKVLSDNKILCCSTDTNIMLLEAI